MDRDSSLPFDPSGMKTSRLRKNSFSAPNGHSRGSGNPVFSRPSGPPLPAYYLRGQVSRERRLNGFFPHPARGCAKRKQRAQRWQMRAPRSLRLSFFSFFALTEFTLTSSPWVIKFPSSATPEYRTKNYDFRMTGAASRTCPAGRRGWSG